MMPRYLRMPPSRPAMRNTPEAARVSVMGRFMVFFLLL
jgi:hypothetical protein